MLDLSIIGGTIVDGTGRPSYKAQIGIKNGLIVEIGENISQAATTLDAEGAIVTPGFIDIHTHYDGQVSWDTMLDPSARNGVTSAAMGNCGVGFAPAKADKHDWLIQLLEGVEDIPGSALAEGLKWNWETFPEYLDAISSNSYTIDVGAHIPHAALRAYVMGERGGDHDEIPTEAEIGKMEHLVFEALQAGALGFSTSRTTAHRSRSGTNINTLSAGEAELIGISKALRRAEKGVVQLISDVYMTNDDMFAESELNLIRRITQTTGRKTSFSVQQTYGAPDRWKYIVRKVENMVAEGLDIKAQIATRPIGLLLTFSSTTNPFMGTATYQRIAKCMEISDRVTALADQSVRAAILSEHKALTAHGAIETLYFGFDKMFRMTDPVDYEPDLRKSLGAQATACGTDPAAFVYDVLLELSGSRLLYMPMFNYVHGNLDDIYHMMASPHTLFGLSDGGAHCGTICDGSFPTTTVSLWSQGTKTGRSFQLEWLVHGYTQRNAEHVGWMDRGVIAPGYLADINIIEHDKLALSPPAIVQDLPAGGTRLLQTPSGYRNTIKSGEVTFSEGKWTGLRPGKLLRGARS